MTEFLIPMPYDGSGTVVCVGFAGLSEAEYDKLEIALNDGEYYEVERSQDNPFFSIPMVFAVSEEDITYPVYGRITTKKRTDIVSARVTAVTYQNEKVESVQKKVVKLALKNRSAILAAERADPLTDVKHGGGAIPSTPDRPKVVVI